MFNDKMQTRDKFKRVTDALQNNCIISAIDWLLDIVEEQQATIERLSSLTETERMQNDFKSFSTTSGIISQTGCGFTKIKKPEAEKDLSIAERVCRTLQGMTLMEFEPKKESLSDLVYKFTHLVPIGGKRTERKACDNLHSDWMKQFEELEKIIELRVYTAPDDRE